MFRCETCTCAFERGQRSWRCPSCCGLKPLCLACKPLYTCRDCTRCDCGRRCKRVFGGRVYTRINKKIGQIIAGLSNTKMYSVCERGKCDYIGFAYSLR